MSSFLNTTERAMDFVVNYILLPMLLVMSVALVIALIALPVHWLSTRNDIPEVTLKMNEWTCNKSHTRSVEICGKTCRWEERTVCDNYERTEPK